MTLTRREHGIPASTKTRTFAEDPTSKPISGEAVAYDEQGNFVLAQWPITDRNTLAITKWLRSALPQTRVARGTRMSGFELATTFGFAPPEPMRRRYACTLCGFDKQYPKVGSALRSLVGNIGPEVQQRFPAEYDLFRNDVADRIHTDHWLGGQPWTSGVVNDKTMLPYNFDRANLAHGLSIQVNIREDATGGALHFPEFDVWLANDNNTVVLFRGGDFYHAVSPIRLQSTRACRYSIVFYAKHAIGRCGPYADEPKRAAKYQTHILRKRIDPDETDKSLD